MSASVYFLFEIQALNPFPLHYGRFRQLTFACDASGARCVGRLCGILRNHTCTWLGEPRPHLCRPSCHHRVCGTHECVHAAVPSSFAEPRGPLSCGGHGAGREKGGIVSGRPAEGTAVIVCPDPDFPSPLILDFFGERRRRDSRLNTMMRMNPLRRTLKGCAKESP